MLDAVRREHLVRPVVQQHRQREDHRALGAAQPLGDEVGDVRELERVVELGQRLLVERRVPLELHRRMNGLGHGPEGT